jgi:uncharacterized membrane protein
MQVAQMLDWPHVHIAINHFPVILAVVGTLSVLAGLVTGRRGLWLYGSASMTLAAITVLPAYFTGSPAEHALDHPWYVGRGVIHAHEESALVSALLIALAGLVSVVAWRRTVRYPRELSLPGWLRAAVAITALAGTASIAYTALLGGRIVHDSAVLLGPPLVRPFSPATR